MKKNHFGEKRPKNYNGKHSLTRFSLKMIKGTIDGLMME
jgi:hypothetical protein